MNIIGDLVGPLNPSYDITNGPVDKENIYRRNGGCGVVAEAKLYVWGGEGAEQRPLVPDSDSEEDDFAKAQVGGIWSVTVLPPPRIADYPFDVYDMHTCTWSRQMTSGDVPLLGLGCSLNYHVETRKLYLFGGWKYGNFDAEVYCIELDEWKWKRIEIIGDIKPVGRYLTGTFIHEWKLCTLGGTGLDIKTKSKRDPQDPGAEYHQCYFKGVGYGLNNEYFELDMNTKQWSAPLGTLARPKPLSCHCFVKFDAHRAILFGGRYKDGQTDDTWIFDLREKIFTGPLQFAMPCAIGRAFTTMTPLIDPLLVGRKLGGCGPILQQKMLLLWGKEGANNILSDVWILEIADNIEDSTWTKVKKSVTFTQVQYEMNTYARAWHTAGPLYYSNSNECRLAIFGGNVHWDGFVGKRRNIGDVRVALFGVASLSRLCAGVIAREGRDVSTYNLPPHSQAYRLIDGAIQTHANATPTLTVTPNTDTNTETLS